MVVGTLPATAAFGKEIIVANFGAAGWTIAQNASQYIQIGLNVTTTGTGGSLQSVAMGDVVRLVCVVANTTWMAISVQGNITYI